MTGKETADLIQLAQAIATRINNQSRTIRRKSDSISVRGTDPNEFKKLFGYLKNERDLKKLKSLIGALKDSAFARRTQQTRAFFENIETGFGSDPHFWELSPDRALYVMGWIGRLLIKH